MTKKEFILGSHLPVAGLFKLTKQVQGFSTEAVSTPEQDAIWEAAGYNDQVPQTQVIYHVTYVDGTTEDFLYNVIPGSL